MVASKSHGVTLIALLLIGSIVLGASLIGLGFYDPIPDNEPIWIEMLDPMQVPSKTREIRWLKEDLPQPPFSIRVTADHDTGELDSAYGVLLGQENGNISVMISPLGFIAIRQELVSTNIKTEDFYLPWQTWPHVQTGDLVNEIIVNLDGNTMSVWINREWLWEASEIGSIDKIGIIGESYGGDAAINFQITEISAADTGK